ncbi:MAG: hypothetical protein LGB78_08730 [Sulfurovum sp.]|nr:hypothetical protein [Sulfurovum sp.]MCB4781012.1 hypothetical protein [Sulfurovum sp.]
MSDATSIFVSKFKPFISTLKNTSFDKDNKVYLCNDEVQEVYDFDAIIKELYPSKQPASYDALIIDSHDIYCIEFKNQKYSDVNRQTVQKKIINGRDVLDNIFSSNNIRKREYKFIYCVVYKNHPSKWRRGITKNIIQFGLEQYKGKYFDEIYTNDISYFTNEYKKQFTRTLAC